MKRAYLLLAASALGLSAALPAVAQDRITGIRDLNDRIDDIDYEVERDLRRSEDAARFGYPEYQPGFSGNASLGFSTQDGNTETEDLSIGVRMRYAQGQWVQTFGLVYDYAESEGVRTEETAFAIYDGNYYFNEQFYVFALARATRDDLADEAGEVSRDGFFGVGPGFRIINQPNVAWRVQAGFGVSYLEDGLGDDETEEGYVASSRFYYEFSEGMYLTNDTDVLSSDTALRANNDLSVNFRVTDAISTRISYFTDYNDSRDIETDNRLGVSLVVGF